MRSPEYNGAMRRPPDGKNFENDYFQYLAPESFTVLPPEGNGQAPNPPRAPEPYKVTAGKRHKNQAFAIIAEPNLNIPGSQQSSRAGSPTGRVSPFRGRGFNPAGSRHASPAPSPPPGHHPLDQEITSLAQLEELQRHQQSAVIKLSSIQTGRISQIPVLKSALRSRRSSAEDLFSPDTSPTEGSSGSRKRQREVRSNLQSNARYSQSMTNIAPKHLISKPPPSPRRSTLKQSFVRLSPIIGSSPEAGSDHIQSSPSRIPRSRSQPPSRLVSPSISQGGSRVGSRNPSRPPSRPASRPVSRNVSRNASRESSPTGTSRSPTKIPKKNSVYRDIPAKIDSFNRTASNKPKVPQKPKVYSTRSGNIDRSRPSSIRKPIINSRMAGKSGSRRDTTEDTETTDTEREREIMRGNSRSSIYSNSNKRANGRGNIGLSRSNSRFVDNEKPSTSKAYSSSGENSKGQLSRSESRRSVFDNGSSKHNSQTYRRDENGAKDSRGRRNETATDTTTEELSKTEDDEDMTEDTRDDEILSVTIDGILSNSTQNIVATTTEAVVKPLNIETKHNKQSDTKYETGNKNATEKISSNQHSDTTTNKVVVTATNGSKTTTTSAVDPNSGAIVKPSNTTTSQNNNPNSSNGNSGLTVPPNGSVASNPSTHPTNSLNNSEKSSAPNSQVSNNVESVNNNVKQLTSSLAPSVNNIEMNVKNNFNNLTPPDSDKVNKNLMDSSGLTNSANERLRQARTVIVDEIQPIKITVREKSGDVEVQSGNYALPRSATNGIAERSLLPSNNHAPNSAEPPPTEPAKPSRVSKLFSWFKKPKEEPLSGVGSTITGSQNIGEIGNSTSNLAAAEEGNAPTFWQKLFGKKSGKVGDSNNSLPKLSRGNDSEKLSRGNDSEKLSRGKDSEILSRGKDSEILSRGKDSEILSRGKDSEILSRGKDSEILSRGNASAKLSRGNVSAKLSRDNDSENWADRRDSILSEPPKNVPFSQKLKKVFCGCRGKQDNRRQSMMSKKKSMSSQMQPPPEDTGPKLDSSLVEHSSHMRGAIPVLPVPLAWTCLIFNVFVPGFGTILSGLICLCIGKPRFSPRDSAKSRFGAFLIDIIVGISQAFTVLFCLVGWGWSIWWGVIMLKVARKYRKIRAAEKTELEETETQPVPSVNINHAKDVERGT